MNLEIIKYEKCQSIPLPTSFKKTCQWTILPSPFKNFLGSPIQGRKLKFTPHPFKKKGEGGPNYVYIELLVFRGSAPEVLFRKMFCKHEATPRGTSMQKSDLNKTASQLYWNRNTHRTPSFRKTPLGNCLRRILKDLNYKKLLFTVIKRNLFTHKIR